jgi:hypothetical protein
MRVRDAAFIRKLCALGLPPRSLVLALLPAQRQVVPAHSGGVFWVDRNGQMTGLYAERLLPPEAMTAYYERHYDTPRRRLCSGVQAKRRARCRLHSVVVVVFARRPGQRLLSATC